MSTINVHRGNILNEVAECIVTPTTPSLMPGSGVSGSVYYMAGEELYNYCIDNNFTLELGHAIATPAFNIPVKHLIHTLGPYWYGGYEGEAKALASCYIESLKLAVSLGVNSIAFPAISTGNGKYPVAEAAEIAVYSIKSFLENHPEIDMTVYLMCYDDDVLAKTRQANKSETLDIVKYLKRKEIRVTNLELTKEEKSLARKGLFKKELSKEKKDKLIYTILKRITVKKKNLILLGTKMTKDKITAKTCDNHHGKKGPYITLDCVSDIHITETKKGPFTIPEKISFVVHPYAYKKEELEENQKNEQTVRDSGEIAKNPVTQPIKKINLENELENL